MFTVFALACLLGGLPVTGDCAAAQTYAPALVSVPPDHWREVKRVVVWDQTHGQWTTRNKTIHLPATGGGPFYLLHEVGHAWALTDEAEMQHAWNAALWPNGQPLGPLDPCPASELAKGDPRRAAVEDLAQSYAHERCGLPVEVHRLAWLYQHAPELRALPRAQCAT